MTIFYWYSLINIITLIELNIYINSLCKYKIKFFSFDYKYLKVFKY